MQAFRTLELEKAKELHDKDEKIEKLQHEIPSLEKSLRDFEVLKKSEIGILDDEIEALKKALKDRGWTPGDDWGEGGNQFRRISEGKNREGFEKSLLSLTDGSMPTPKKYRWLREKTFGQNIWTRR